MTTRRKHHRAPNSGSISLNSSGTARAQFCLPGNKRITRSFTNKRDAEAWLREMRNEVDSGLTASTYNITLDDFIKDWWKRKKPGLAPKSQADYYVYIEKMIRPKLGMYQVRAIKLPHVNKFYLTLADEGRPVSVIRYVHRVLRTIFSDAMRQGLLSNNPACHADVPKADDDQDKMTILAQPEYQRFIAACMDSTYGVLYHFAIRAGMRQGELLGLTWKNVDLERGEIRIIQQLSRFGQSETRLVLSPLKTSYSRRAIRIDNDLVELLKLHHRAQQEYEQIIGCRWKENDLVFPSSTGTPLDQRNMQRDFDKMLRFAGLPKIRFHDLRHNAASRLLAEGYSIVDVSRYLGHSSPRITLEQYAHLMPTSLVKRTV